MIEPPVNPAAALASLQGLEVFQGLEPARLAALASSMTEVELAAGATLLRQGDPGTALFIVVSGRLRASVGGLVVGHLGPGELVGEIQSVVGGTRLATVEAEEPATLYELPGAAVDRLVASSPETLQRFTAIIRRRLQRGQLLAVLPALLGPLDDLVIGELEARIGWVTLRRGEALFHQGDPGDSWYLIVHGRLQIAVARPEGGEKVIRELGRGESLGEIALLTGEPRTATPWAIRDTELLRIAKMDFDEIMVRYPRVLMSITQVLIRRIVSGTGGPARPRTLNLAVVPAAPGAPLAAFARALVEAFGQIGPTLHLSSERLGTLGFLTHGSTLPDDHPVWIRFRGWLDEQDARYSFIVFEADATLTGWTARAMRQADHVLIVADASGPSAPGEVEATLYEKARDDARRARRSLVLLHPPETRLPSGTAAWLAARQVDGHHHLRRGTRGPLGDVGRVARLISGHGVGLALGGGGARGFAHLGILKALGEAGVPVDMIGGTSIGSIMAAMYALGLTHEEMLALNRRIIALRPFNEYTVPMVAMLRSRRIAQSATMCFGDTQIEDLWTGYFAVSSNLTTTEMVVHDRGSLAFATLASGAIPGIALPVVQGGDLLVDGGVINNLPGDVMRERCRGKVIVANVSPEEGLPVGASGLPSQWSLFWNRALPFKKRLPAPGIFDILMRTMMLGSAARAHRVERDADLYLRPAVDRYGMLEFDKLLEIVEAGYQHALAELPKWTGARVEPRR